YYRYFNKLIGSNEVPISSFAAVWKQIAQEVVNHPAVEGYGLMNEPHSTNGLWPQAALAAAQAIRTVDSKRWIYVAGDRWSSAFHWPHYNTQLISNPWMRDYYRYFNKLIGSNEVPISSFAAVWKQIAQEVVN
ncbi:cellulase family glycosylhydrolase, partial [Acinetobacter baumannii]|uniref:cellulase family glycosylhydrolase n=1 Tax=Acinetobacter baumannii TaxID=470 RepID=UPI001D174A55